MASSSRFARPQKVISVIMLLLALHATAFAGPAMANSPFNAKTATLQSRLVQALKDKGGFTAAATFLGAVDLNHLLPESSTILVPMDEDLTESGLQVSNFNTALPILQYHVITKRLAFVDLQRLPEGETLETLLPNNTVIITSNSISNFSVDDVPLSHGNLFLASSTAVHGIRGVLSFALYGRKKNLHNFQPAAPPTTSSPEDGGEPGKQPIPPSAGKGSSSTGNQTAPLVGATGNETQSSTSPSSTGNATPSTAPGFNSSVSPPITPAPTQVSANASSSTPLAPVSLAEPAEPPPNHRNPSPMAPPSISQQAVSPVFPTNCDDLQPFCFSPSSANHLKPWTFKDIFSAVLFLLACGVLLVKAPTTPRLTLLYVTLVLMAASPTSGEMNVDVSEVLRSKGGFGYAATYLQALDMRKVLPNRSTVLVPTDAAIEATGLIYNTLGAALPTLRYHVVTKQLSFEDLQKLSVGTTLETLLPSSSLVITSNAASNFTVNDVLLSHPDLFCSDGTTVHGISGVMNFSRPAVLDAGLPHMQTPPRSPHLILPLPESAGPFAAPLPVSQAASVLEILNVSRLTLLTLLACISCCFLLTFNALSSSNHRRRLPATQSCVNHGHLL